MPDIHSAAPPSLSTPTTSATPTTSLTAIQVAIESLSQSLQDLTHAIQTNATPVAAPNGNSLTLATALGKITVTLPQLAEAAQQDLQQQLLTLLQAQRPLTLSLQPVPPPTQATLILPTALATTAAAGQAAVNAAVPLPAVAQTASAVLSLQPVVKGDVLPAIVLPPTVSAPQTATAPMAQSYAPVLQQILQNTAVTQNVPMAQTPAPVLAAVSVPVASPVLNAETPEPVTVSATVPLQAVSPAPVSATPAPPQTPIVIQPVMSQPASQTVAEALPPLPQLPQAPSVPQQPTAISTPAATPLAALLQPGTEVTLQVNAVMPPAVNPAALPPLAPNQIVATVTGNMPDGRLIVQAADATLFIKAPVAAPVGTNLVVTVERTQAAPLTLLPLPQMPGLQSLTQAMAALAQSNPQALQQMMAMRIPQPNEMLPTTLLLLFGGFKQADARAWLGSNATDSLSYAGKDDIVASLSRDLAAAGQSVQDPVVGEWRSYPIPLYAQQQFQALTLYVHDNKNQREGRDQGDSSDGKKTRFLIDMRLSKLGAIQLDGFVQTKKLDMILRSEAVLPAGLHNELRQSYIDAMGAVGYTGALNFQVGRQHWLNIQRNASQGIMT